MENLTKKPGTEIRSKAVQFAPASGSNKPMSERIFVVDVNGEEVFDREEYTVVCGGITVCNPNLNPYIVVAEATRLNILEALLKADFGPKEKVTLNQILGGGSFVSNPPRGDVKRPYRPR